MPKKPKQQRRTQPQPPGNGLGIPTWVIGCAIAVVAVALVMTVDFPDAQTSVKNRKASSSTPVSKHEVDDVDAAESIVKDAPPSTKVKASAADATEKETKASAKLSTLDQWAATFSKSPTMDATTADFLRSLPPNPAFNPLVEIAEKYDSTSTLAKQMIKRMKKLSSKKPQDLLYIDMMLWKKFGEAINANQVKARNFYAQCIKSVSSQARMNDKVMEGGITHLLQATRAGDADVVESLLIAGADVNVADDEGVRAVDLAFSRWNGMQMTMHNAQCNPGFGVNVVRILSETRLDTSHIDREGRNLLRVAVDARHLSATKLLLQRDPTLATHATKQEHSTSLHSIVDPSVHTITGAKWLINHGNVAQSIDYECKHDSVSEYNMSATSILRSKTFQRHHDHTTLAHEVHQWLSPFVDALIAAGINVNAKDAYGRTALHIAAAHGNTPAVTRLMAAGADPIVEDKMGVSPVQYAINSFYMNVARIIAAEAPPNVVSEPEEPSFTTSTVSRVAGALKDWGGVRTAPILAPEDVDDCRCDIDVRADLEYSEFLSKYWSRGRPVLIRGGLKWLTKTGDVKFWGRSRLMKTLSGINLKSAHVETGVLTNSSETSLDDYWEYLEAQKHKLAETYDASTPSADTIIETKWDLTKEAGLKLSRALEGTPAGWLGRDTKITPLRLNNVQINVAPPYAGTSFHFHHATMSALVQGRKRWFLKRPADSIYSNAHFFDDFKDIQDGKLGRTLQCTQQSLDVLFLPSMWGHGVLYEENSIATSFLYTTQY
eukprot:m.236616 g.236616  ORF g.236616 m.236616 type:complete len:775 (-) comp33689_c0_seq2:18-2342(-)